MASTTKPTSSALADAIAAHFPGDAEATIAATAAGWIVVIVHRGAVAKFEWQEDARVVNWVDLRSGGRRGWLDVNVGFIREHLFSLGARAVHATAATSRMEGSLIKRGFVRLDSGRLALER